jgi:uncharacterized protein YdbL (DUF1318 family)
MAGGEPVGNVMLLRRCSGGVGGQIEGELVVVSSEAANDGTVSGIGVCNPKQI